MDSPLSIILPAKNEAGNLAPVLERLAVAYDADRDAVVSSRWRKAGASTLIGRAARGTCGVPPPRWRISVARRRGYQLRANLLDIPLFRLM